MDPDCYLGAANRRLLHLWQCTQYRACLDALLRSRLFFIGLSNCTPYQRKSQCRLAGTGHLFALAAEHYLPAPGFSRQHWYLLVPALALPADLGYEPSTLYRGSSAYLWHLYSLKGDFPTLHAGDDLCYV